MKEIRYPAGTQFRALAPLRADFVGMSDYYQSRGRNINACLLGLNAELFATFRNDDRVKVDAGVFGKTEKRLAEIYESSPEENDSMFFKALLLHPQYRLCSGMDVEINCQYGAGGLSTSSSVAAAIHAFIWRLFGLPDDPWSMVWKVIQTEPHRYGRQDQMGVVFGGISMWEMKAEKFDYLKPLPLTFQPAKRYSLSMCNGTETALAESILLYESGINCGADQILQGVAKEFKNNPKVIQAKFDIMNNIAADLWKNVLCSHISTSAEMADRLGFYLNQVRDAHAALHPDVINQRIADLIDTGIKNGATGARPTGAGARGVIMFAVPSHHQASLEAALDKCDTPEPGSKQPCYGKIQRFSGFDHHGARCWASKF